VQDEAQQGDACQKLHFGEDVAEEMLGEYNTREGSSELSESCVRVLGVLNYRGYVLTDGICRANKPATPRKRKRTRRGEETKPYMTVAAKAISDELFQ
jgi:hypothetical protein